MSRDWKLYWGDILLACGKVMHYTAGMDRAAFEADERTVDAVLRNLEIIVEAVKSLPDEARALAPQIQWKDIAGMRDILAHAYFGVSRAIVWDVVTNKVPELRATMEAIGLDLAPE